MSAWDRRGREREKEDVVDFWSWSWSWNWLDLSGATAGESARERKKGGEGGEGRKA